MSYAERIITEIIIECDADHDISWNTHDNGTIYAFVLCNDLFFWGAADGEEIKESDIPDVVQAYKDSKFHGEILWCCRKRKMRPQGAYYKHLKADAALFDACGPRRETDFGNPQDQDDAMVDEVKKT